MLRMAFPSRTILISNFDFMQVCRPSDANLTTSFLRLQIRPCAPTGNVETQAINPRLRGEIQRAVIRAAPVEVVRLFETVHRSAQPPSAPQRVAASACGNRPASVLRH